MVPGSRGHSLSKTSWEPRVQNLGGPETRERLWPSHLLGSDSTHHHRQLLSGALSQVTLCIAHRIGEATDCTLPVQRHRASLMPSQRARYWICPWLSLRPGLGQLHRAQLRNTEARLECQRGGLEAQSPQRKKADFARHVRREPQFTACAFLADDRARRRTRPASRNSVNLSAKPGSHCKRPDRQECPPLYWEPFPVPRELHL